MDGESSPARDKEDALVAWIRGRSRVAIGYSGGVDSAYLASVLLETLGPRNVLGIIGRSASYPESQWIAARTIARQIGLPLLELETHEMADPRYTANPTNRCYFCKTELWSRVVPAALAQGFTTVVDGTNADDLADYRPGRASANEWNVQSPLAAAGLTKSDIRERSRVRSLPCSDQPSSPCLSSRLPYGMAVTVERLAQVERAEAALRALGVVGDLRVRHHGDLARVELAPHEIDEWLTPPHVSQLVHAVRGAGFSRVTVDLGGFRSGSLNVLSGVTAA